jgi:hypothetical protein
MTIVKPPKRYNVTKRKSRQLNTLGSNNGEKTFSHTMHFQNCFRLSNPAMPNPVILNEAKP